MDEVHVDTDSIQKAGIHREQDSNVNINIENPDTVPRNTDQEGNQANTNKKTPKKICIIGCRSWLVLVSGFMCFFLTDGFVFHTSVLFLELQDTFHKSKAETAVVQSVATGAFLCGGVFSGFIITKLGVVRAGLVGASLDVIGLAASFFAPNIPYLVVCLGLTTGLVKDQTDSYDGVMYAACGVSSTTVVILIIIRILRTKNNSKLVLKEIKCKQDIAE